MLSFRKFVRSYDSTSDLPSNASVDSIANVAGVFYKKASTGWEALTTAAASISVADAAALLTATDLEAALLELVKYECVTLADVGSGAAIPVTRSLSMSWTQAGAETNSVAAPTFAGQELMLCCGVDTSGARVITFATAINQAGNTIATFSDVKDFLHVKAMLIAGVLAWRVIANDGVVLS